MDKTLLNSRPRSEWEALIHEWIHNEKDRWLITRRLLDGIPYDALTGEYQLKFEIPLPPFFLNLTCYYQNRTSVWR